MALLWSFKQNQKIWYIYYSNLTFDVQNTVKV